jgi:hypothetical protein
VCDERSLAGQGRRPPAPPRKRPVVDRRLRPGVARREHPDGSNSRAGAGLSGAASPAGAVLAVGFDVDHDRANQRSPAAEHLGERGQ